MLSFPLCLQDDALNIPQLKNKVNKKNQKNRLFFGPAQERPINNAVKASISITYRTNKSVEKMKINVFKKAFWSDLFTLYSRSQDLIDMIMMENKKTERGGFEPPVLLRAHWFSKPAR